MQGRLAGEPAAEGRWLLGQRHQAEWDRRCHLHLPAVGTVFAEQAGLQEDFAERIQGFGDPLVHPSSATAQHLRDFVARERVQSDQGDHLGVLLAEPRKAELDVAHEDHLVLKAGNGVMRDPGAKKLSSQQRGKPADLARRSRRNAAPWRGSVRDSTEFPAGDRSRRSCVGRVVGVRTAVTAASDDVRLFIATCPTASGCLRLRVHCRRNREFRPGFAKQARGPLRME